MLKSIPTMNGWPRRLAVAATVIAPIALLAYTLSPVPFPPTPTVMPVGYVAQDELTNYNLTSGREVLFRSEYNRNTWSGNLHAYPMTTAGTLNPVEKWTGGAAAIVSAQNWDTGRLIATLDNSSTPAGVPFRSTNAAVSSAIGTATINGTAYTADQIIRFLRGDTSNDTTKGGQMRARNSALGDIIHARPLYTNDGTNDVVFVGANDGMLHAFSAATGTELWAYVPSMLMSKMQTLSYNDTVTTTGSVPIYTHDYFVDGQVNLASVKNSSGSTITELVGGLGAGGRGLYALDVTTKTAGTETDVGNKILWEISNDGKGTSVRKVQGTSASSTATNDYPQLGYTFGTPLMVRINTTTGTTPSYVDAIIVGNGYDDSKTTGEAHLYVIKASDGSLMKDFKVSNSSYTGINGIFNPKAIDKNGDGYVDTVYAADLNGSLWKFDLSAAWTSSGSWSPPSAPLFSDAITVGSTTTTQPITGSLGVAAHPSGGYMITFGTGSTLNGQYGVYNGTTWTTAATGEIGNTAIHYVYGIWDGPATSGTVTQSQLQVQTITPRTYTYTDRATNLPVTVNVRRASATPLTSSQRGWKVALPNTGERVVGEGGFIENGRFYFNTYNPTVTPYLVPGTSTYIFGENWLMELNYLTGGSSASPFLDLNGDLLLNDGDRIVYSAADPVPNGSTSKLGDPITSPNESGIAVGKQISIGVQSQPVLVQLSTLNTTLLNQNPDVLFPASTTIDRGVAGGHFDVDSFFAPACTGMNTTAGGSYATGSVTFSYNSPTSSSKISSLVIKVGNDTVYTLPSATTITPQDLATLLSGQASAKYRLAVDSTTMNNNNKKGSPVVYPRVMIYAINVGSTYNATVSVTMTYTPPSSPPAAQAYTTADATGGTDYTTGTVTDSNHLPTCAYNTHVHQYDDSYDRTGVNFLNASDPSYNLSNAIPSTSMQFKVLLMNQFLNPAMQLHIGGGSNGVPAYDPALTQGYTSVNSYQTSAGLTLDKVTTYTRATIGSLVLNMPVDAFSVKSTWWPGDSSSRVGVMPTAPACAYWGKLDSLSSNGNNIAGLTADLYNPVTPDSTVNPGGGTTLNSTGARHNGAITLQVIRAETPAAALELNVSGHPEYGYRVSDTYFYDFVLAEYSIYWHHPRSVCFGDATTKWSTSGKWNTTATMTGKGWTPDAPPDNLTGTANKTPATGSTDPKLGTLGQGGSGATSVVTTTSGNVTTTTITYADKTTTLIVVTNNTNDNTQTTVTTQRDSSGNTVGSPTSVTTANASGTVKTGGDERGLSAKLGRISWRELLRP